MSKYRADILTTQHLADYKFDNSDSGGDDTMTWVDNRTFPVIKYDGNNYIFFVDFISPDEQISISGAYTLYEGGGISEYIPNMVRFLPTFLPTRYDILENSDVPLEVFPILFFRYDSSSPDLDYNTFSIEHISKIESYRQDKLFEGYFNNITEVSQLKSYPWFFMGTQKVQLPKVASDKIVLDLRRAYEEQGIPL